MYDSVSYRSKLWEAQKRRNFAFFLHYYYRGRGGGEKGTKKQTSLTPHHFLRKPRLTELETDTKPLTVTAYTAETPLAMEHLLRMPERHS